jgi:Tfp pilus assembly protein PilF
MEAEQAYRALLKSQHRHFDATHLLGLSLLQQGKIEAAERQLDRALRFAPRDSENPNVAEANNNHGLALSRLRRFDEALARFEQALLIRPDHVDALSNRAAALQELYRPDEALDAYDAVLAVQPRFAAACNNRGKTLGDLGRYEEALASFTQAIALEPDYADAFYNRGLVHLLLTDFARGWEDCEHRLRTADYRGLARFVFAAKPEAIRDKRVLVLAEQGIGDEILFASMIPDLARNAKSVTLECDPRLIGLFGRSFPGVDVIPRQVPHAWNEADFDCTLCMGSLGRLYRSNIGDFPHGDAYLAADADIAAYWRARLAQHGGGLKIGISWKGGTAKTRAHMRSIPLQHWGPLFANAKATFVSLQYGDVREEVWAAQDRLAQPIVTFEPSEISDFDQLAGLVSSLDLIVTVQTALVHLAGAVGKDCRVMVPSIPEWGYGVRGEHMPWYSSVTLFRQERQGEWAATLGRVAASLPASDGVAR